MNNRDPVMGGNALNRGEKRLTGIDLIYEYLKIIRMEKKFLDCFDRQAVVNLMSAIYPQYQELYLDKGKRHLSQYLFPIYNHHFYTAGSRLSICRPLHLSLLIQEVFKNITVPLRKYVFSDRISELLPVHTPEQVLPAHSPLQGCRTGMLRI